jgi:hypothetical protein
MRYNSTQLRFISNDQASRIQQIIFFNAERMFCYLRRLTNHFLIEILVSN